MVVEMFPNERPNDTELNDMLKSMGHQPMLKLDEELALIQKIQDEGTNHDEALHKLVQSNMRFVVAVAKQYVGKTDVPIEKLIEAGNKGVELASTRYDKSGGYKFISYALWWIRQSILEVIKSEE